MSIVNSESWVISGTVLKIDEISPFTVSDGLSIRIFKDDNPNSLSDSGIYDSNGNFSITLNKQQFQSSPNLIIKVFDSQNRVLYTSNAFSPSFSEDNYSVGDIKAIKMPIPTTWLVHGIAYQQDGTTPFTQGSILAYGEQNGVYDLWFGQDGLINENFTITIPRDMFQQNNIEIEEPRIIIMVRDNSYNVIWQSNPFTVPYSEYYIYPIVGNPDSIGSATVPNTPEVPENWSVSGMISINGSTPLIPLKVKVFDVLLGVETPLGDADVQICANGTYQIVYTKSAFQKGDFGRIAPNLLVKVFSTNNILINSSGLFSQVMTNAVINIGCNNLEYWSVSGVICGNDSQPLQGAVVKAYYAHDIQLGVETFTDANGFYRIFYSKYDFSCQVLSDLFIKVFENDEEIGCCDNEEHTPPSTEINLSLASVTIPQRRFVEGIIRDKDLHPLQGVIVIAYDNPDTLLGNETYTDTSGYYRIEYDWNNSSGRTAPDLYVKVCSGCGELTRSDIVEEAPPNAEIDVTLTAEILLCRIVNGTVYNKDSHPQPSVTVRAYELLPSGDDLALGNEVQTGADGSYRIEYIRVDDSSVPVPDLYVKVYDITGKELGRSEVEKQADAPAITTIDVKLVAESWKISGKITSNNPNQTSWESWYVDVWDIFGDREFPIGSCEINSTGNYTVNFNKVDFQRGNSTRQYPHLLIRIYNLDGIMVGYGYPSYQDSENYQYNYSLPEVKELFHVSGQISNTLGYPVSGCVVIVKNILLSEGVFRETELGRTESVAAIASLGVYNISFYPDLVSNLCSLDLARFVVEVYIKAPNQTKDRPAGPLEFASKSNLLKAVEEILSADFVIDASSSVDISQFTDIFNKLVDNGFTKNSIIELASDESKLEYAVDLTGEPREEILNIALAEFILSVLKDKLTSGLPNKVNDQVTYALVKTGNAVCFEDLLKITADRLQAVLISAITQSIIPPDVQDNLSDIVYEWQEIYSILLINGSYKSNAGRIFGYAIPESSEYYAYYSIVLDTYSENAHDLEKFWVELEAKLKTSLEELSAEDAAHFIDGLVNRLKFFFDIHMFADEFKPLSNAMMEYADMENENKQKYTALEDFVGLENTEWLYGVVERIEDFTEIKDSDEIVEWPELVPGESDDEKRSNYATILYKRIIEMFPMARFRFDLEKVMTNHDCTENSEYCWWSPIQQFLRIKPMFDFIETITEESFYCDANADNDFHSCVDANGHHYISGFDEDKMRELYSKLLIVQRIYRLTPKFNVIYTLIKNGFTSAMSIAHKNCDEFAEQYSEIIGGIDDTQALHAVAVHIASQALFLMGTFNKQTDLPESSIPAVTEKHEPESAPTPQSSQGEQVLPIKGLSAMSLKTSVSVQASNEASVYSNTTESISAQVAIKPIVPNIATLFGSQNQCFCPECQSVFSPSAYMVDMLEFLNDEVRDALFSRRPDLSETDLSCQNTNGAVAYIDLVNEILEDAVCSRKFFVKNVYAINFLLIIKAEITKNNDDNNMKSFSIEEILSSTDDGLSSKNKDELYAFFYALTKEFGLRGFCIDKEFYVQCIKDEVNKWYIVGDCWRYQIESSYVAFLITPYPQTGKDAQLRRVKPEHTHWGAYDVLKHSPYPTNLPFNFPFIEVNEFLKLKKSNRHELYQALNTRDEAFTVNKACMQAFFEMTNQQKKLITLKKDQTTNVNYKVWELWGLSLEDELYLLNNAEAVMKKLDITLDQFLDLMHTYFVNLFDIDHPVYLDWGNGDAYENGELNKLMLKKRTETDPKNDRSPEIEDYSRMIRLQRLSNHLELDVITLDRLLLMGCLLKTDSFGGGDLLENLTIDNCALNNLFKCMKIAEEFSVSPIRASSWLCCWIENFNLGRGGLSQFEELFLSNIDTPKRAAVWKEMLNDTHDENNRNFETGDNANSGDIATLLKGLNVNYQDLSVIMKNEFNFTLTEIKTIPDYVKLRIDNLAKMFRVADFSRVLGISVSDFYKVKSICSDTTYFSHEFLIKCRSVIAKLKKFKISFDEFQYLLSGENADKISWLTAAKDLKDVELKTIIKIHDEIIKTKLCYAEDSPDLPEAIEETVLNQLAASYKIPVDTCRTVLYKALSVDSGKPLLEHWVDICSGGWKVDFYGTNDAFITSGTVPRICIEAQSEIDFQTIPSPDVKKIRWSSFIVVPQTAKYTITVSTLLISPEEGESSGTVRILFPDEESSSDSPLSTVTKTFEKNATYRIEVEWTSTNIEAVPTNIDVERLNITCMWEKTDETSETGVLSSFIGTENTLLGIGGYLNEIANVAYLIQTLKISVDEFDFLTNYPNTVYGLNFNKLGKSAYTESNRKALVSLLDVYILDKEIPFKNKEVTIFDILHEAQKAESVVSFGSVIAKEIDWEQEDISEIVSSFVFTLNDFKQIDFWFVLNRTCRLLKKLGLTASFARELILEADNSMPQSEALIGTLKATYTNSQWVEAAEPIRNNMRRLQRDALCAYLLSSRSAKNPESVSFEANILNSLFEYKLGKDSSTSLENKWDKFKNHSNITSDEEVWNLLDGRTNPVNRAAIYAKYLIDVNMDTDVMTTRIVQANCSIQMLLQRALLNFESFPLNDKIKQQWSWMKNYRLWEASRKIFLYPENWLEPEFRDDKTPLFKELESSILQKELNPSSIQEAFKSYVSGLNEIANLEVIGTYEESGQDGNVLHIVGRTFHYPHSYYYRKNHDGVSASGYWTPWEKVDLDITSDVVLPVPFRNKIYIFWPVVELKEKAIENQNGRENESQYKDSLKYFEIKLAWSEFHEGKWSAKRFSQSSCIHIAENIDIGLIKHTDLFHFKAFTDSDKVDIHVYAYNKTIEEFTVKVRVIKNCTMRGWFGARRTIRVPGYENVVNQIEHEAISQIAVFSFGSDNSANLVPASDTRDYMQSGMIPAGTTMCHNRAEESEEMQNSSNFGALEYPKSNMIFGRTPERFTCFSTNLSFFDDVPKPFFLKLNEKTLFIKPVPSPKQTETETHTLDSDNKTYYKIDNFYHPLADDLVRRVNRNSIEDLLNRSVQANSKDQYPLGYKIVGDSLAHQLAETAFKYNYLPQDTILGGYPLPVSDFSLDSAFGVYNWELFFHLPMYIASRLSHDNQHEEAMRWFHCIFNPANDFTTWEKSQRWTWDLPEGARFWNFLPFFANRGVKDTIYKAVEESQINDQDTMLGSLIDAWKNDPFKPHLIARVRTAAYQKSVVMKYLDNLIEWGDGLFRLDNMESVNEATQLYVQASEILGDRPILVPKLHEMPGLTYTQLKAEGLDQFGNTVIQLENYIPPTPPIKIRLWRAKQAPSRYYYYHYAYNYNYTYNSSVEAIPHKSVQLLRMAPALHYFGIPRNERLIAYWDTVEDRLFKIHHSLNIDGVKRVLPLFAPPIDPGMLARASSMGINIGELLKNIQSTPTVYRFATVFQKAMELCNELKSFGSELMSALEKKDAEALSLLRNNHETEMLKLVKDVKKKAVEESNQNLEALLKTKAITEERYDYYKGIERTSEAESLQFTSTAAAATLHGVGQAMKLASGPLAMIPNVIAGALVGLSGGPIVVTESGGDKASDASYNVGDAFIQSATIFDRIASISGIKASYDRRWSEWKLQERLAKKELAQIDKQILSAQIRVSIAEKDLSNHEKQIEQSETLKEVMESKFSNEKLYQWMAEELNKSYNSLYDIAYSAAKKAENAFRFEFGSSKSFVSPEIWDSTKKGLLAGNRLSVQLRQMDAAYTENNKRELEITKAVSLNMLDPYQLLKLRETGFCKFELPERIFDFDCPGHYFRRIKSVRITIPCVAGPYTNISATLRLEKSKVRTNAALKDGEYDESPEDSDSRFLYNPIPIASISTSGAMMDSGMFDFNFRDERYLPFEGAGAVSKWSLEFPSDYRQFDYNTITDVILHVSYTAREATSVPFKDSVIDNLDKYLENLDFIPNLISLKQSFYEQFESIVNGNAVEISLKDEHFPHLIVDYWKRKKKDKVPDIINLKIFVLLKNSTDSAIKMSLNGGCPISFEEEETMPNLYELQPENIGSCPWSLKLQRNEGCTYEVEDIFLYFGYLLTEEEKQS